MEGNNQPFAEGQKVVALKTGFDIIKGEVYTVSKCFQCKCGIWMVILMEFPGIDRVLCSECDRLWKKAVINATLFAPINPYSIDLTKELADSFKESPECPDRVIVPEKVNN
jgi:hypothetical protein